MRIYKSIYSNLVCSSTIAGTWKFGAFKRRFWLCTRAGRYFSSEASPISVTYNVYDEQHVDPKASPIVIMHGVFGSKNNWHSLSKVIHRKSTRKVISVDARNHGDSPHVDYMDYISMSHDIQHLCEILKFNKVILVGHSMGGKTAMVTALTKPQLLEKLVVVDISPTVSAVDNNLPTYVTALKNVTFPANISRSKVREYANNQLTPLVPDVNVRQFLLTNLLEKDGQYSWKVNLNSIEANFHHILSFPKFSNPYNGDCLFIGGQFSGYISENDKPEIQRLFPKAEIKYVCDAGHFVHSEKPNEFLEILLPFVQIQ